MLVSIFLWIFWLLWLCFINVLFKVITNFKFDKGYIRKHICIIGWCFMRQRNSYSPWVGGVVGVAGRGVAQDVVVHLEPHLQTLAQLLFMKRLLTSISHLPEPIVPNSVVSKTERSVFINAGALDNLNFSCFSGLLCKIFVCFFVNTKDRSGKGQIDFIMENRNFCWIWNNYLICVFGINRSYVNVHFVKICCLRSSVNPRSNKNTNETSSNRPSMLHTRHEQEQKCSTMYVNQNSQPKPGLRFRIRNIVGRRLRISIWVTSQLRIRISLISVKSKIRIRIKVRRWIRIRIKVMRIRNPDLNP